MTFLLDQVLNLRFFRDFLNLALTDLGLTGALLGSVHFFIYDLIKITYLLCLLIFSISYIQSYFPPERSQAILGRFNGMSARIIAALLGTITPFCSCSSIPLFIGFTRAGLPLGVTFAFLISSPMVDLASLVLISSIFGFNIALAYVLLGLAIAIIGGTLIDKLTLEDQIEDIVRPQESSINIIYQRPSIKERLLLAYEQMSFTLKKVFWYILIGVALGALIHNWLPQEYIQTYLGQSTYLSVIGATLLGVPMYADIFGTIPVAEALIGKGALLGTVLSFMMSVTTLSLPSLILLRQAIKTKLLLTFISICVIGIILVGVIFNLGALYV